MRVRLEVDEALFVEVVHDPLHVPAMASQIARDPRDRLRAIGVNDRAENLPARTRQPESGDKSVPHHEESAVEPEQVEHQVGQGHARCGRFHIAHGPP